MKLWPHFDETSNQTEECVIHLLEDLKLANAIRQPRHCRTNGNSNTCTMTQQGSHSDLVHAWVKSALDDSQSYTI